MPIMQRCCLFCPLKIGVIILACLTIAYSVTTVFKICFLGKPYVLIYLVVPYHVALIAISICLLVATHLEKARYIVPWLYGQIFCTLIFVTAYFIYNAVGSPLWQIYATLATLNFTFGIYFWFCVFSYYEELLSYWDPDAID